MTALVSSSSKCTNQVNDKGSNSKNHSNYSSSSSSNSKATSRKKNTREVMPKMKWTKDEDQQLTCAVKKYNQKNWRLIASEVPGRTSKQCLERWYGILDPTLLKTEFTQEEDDILIELQEKFGNKWSLISDFLPGRSTISIRNRSDLLKRHAKNPSLAFKQSLSSPSTMQLQLQEKNQHLLNNTSASTNATMNSSTKVLNYNDYFSACNEQSRAKMEEGSDYSDDINYNIALKSCFSGDSWTKLDKLFDTSDQFLFCDGLVQFF